MSRRHILIIGAMLVIIIIVGLIMFFGRNSGPAVSSGDNNSQAIALALFPVKDAPTSETVSIGTKGGTLTVKNFYRQALGQEGDTVLIKKGDGYEITYDRFSSDFWIIINSEPVLAILNLAESDILSTLGISRQQACVLSVSWRTAEGVDAAYPFGESFPLSFCLPAI